MYYIEIVVGCAILRTAYCQEYMAYCEIRNDAVSASNCMYCNELTRYVTIAFFRGTGPEGHGSRIPLDRRPTAPWAVCVGNFMPLYVCANAEVLVWCTLKCAV